MAGKIGTGAVLAVLFLIAAVSRAPFAVFLLALAVLLTAFLLWDAHTLRRQVQAALQLPEKPVHPGEAFTVTVQLTNTGKRPVPELRAVLRAADAETGSVLELPCSAMLAPGQKAALQIKLRPSKAGLWHFSLSALTVWDHLGVFAADCAVPAETWTFCVLPPAEGEANGTGTAPSGRAEQENGTDTDSADGMYDLRPYRAGDAINLIHWKLTAKLEELTVREPLGTRYRADPAGSLEATNRPTPQTVFHFGQTAVTRLRTLTRRHAADPATGLVFENRVLLSRSKTAPRPAPCAGVDLALLLLVTLGLLTAVNSAFALALPLWVWPGTALLCLGWLALCSTPLPAAARRGLLLGTAILYLVLLFVVQQDFLAGAAQLVDAVRGCLALRFGTGEALQPVQDPGLLGRFVLLALVPITGFFTLVIARHTDSLLLGLVLLPACLFLALAGQSGSPVGWLLLLPGGAGVMAAARSVQRKKLWGTKDSAAYTANLQTFTFNQKTTAAAMALVCAGMFLPAFALGKALQVPLNALQPVTDRAAASVLSAAVTWLPRISGGALNIHVSAAAGGVEDGSLTQSDGLALEGLEDLIVTVSEKPAETIYLRGFVGAAYDGQSWQAADSSTFASAAANWKTEGDAALAVANLPFLRAAYDGTAEPQQITVQRIHANEAYTYIPYNAYLNDYYVLDGDGAAAGQTVQDDTFYYFPRKQAASLLQVRGQEEPSVLDRLESSYSGFAAAQDTALPDGAGYDTLKDQCSTLVKEQKVKADDTDAILRFVRRYLNETCTYSDAAPQPETGEDSVLYFLNESHAGGSPQFASAAVMLCRIMGLPARYVVGYAASQNLFTAQGDGSYRAVLQDDNAHAWAEVYLDGQGWIPLEVTPGMVGELEEVPLDADTSAATQTPDAAQNDAPLPQTESAPAALGRRMALLAGVPVILLLAACLGLVIHRARRTPEQIVRDEFRALYRKMRRCGLPADVSSDEPAFRDFLLAHCRDATPQTVDHLLTLVQAAQFAPTPCTDKTARTVRALCRSLRKK